jgi:DNA repair protein RadC
MRRKNWLQHQQPREKLLQKGARYLSNTELLSVLFGSGSRQKSVFDISHSLLEKFGSLTKLFNSDLSQCCQQNGVGLAKYTQLQAAAELHCRYLKESLVDNPCLQNSSTVKQFLIAKLKSQQREVFSCLFLDSHYRLIAFDTLFFGTINQSSIHLREIIKKALHFNAAALIAAHNHPSGEAKPSHADKQITKKLQQALRLIDIKLLDHIIVAGSKTFSFSEHGLLI